MNTKLTFSILATIFLLSIAPTQIHADFSRIEAAQEENRIQKQQAPSEELKIHSPKDGLPKDGLPKDGLPKDGLPKDGLPKDGLPKDGLPKDGLPKDGLPKDGLPKDEFDSTEFWDDLEKAKEDYEKDIEDQKDSYLDQLKCFKEIRPTAECLRNQSVRCSSMTSCCSALTDPQNSISSCFACEDFKPEFCDITFTDKQNQCEIMKNVFKTMKLMNCYCSECILTKVNSMIQKLDQNEAVFSPIKSIEKIIAKEIEGAMNQKRKEQNPINVCKNTLLCESIDVNFDIKVLDAISHITVKQSFCCGNMPRLVGLEELIAFGENVCSYGEDGLCIKLLPNERSNITRWINKNRILQADSGKMCSLKTVSKSYEPSVILPILIDIGVKGETNYDLGILAEIEVPFQVQFEIEYSLPNCNHLVARNFHAYSVAVNLKISESARKPALLPIKGEVQGDVSRFKEKFLYTATYAAERNIRKALEVDENLKKCVSIALGSIPDFQCTFNTKGNREFDCGLENNIPPDIASQCLAGFQESLKKYQTNLIPNIVDAVTDLYKQ